MHIVWTLHPARCTTTPQEKNDCRDEEGKGSNPANNSTDYGP